MNMRMFRGEIVWAVLAAYALAFVACPAETVLCSTAEGSVKVETALNGACNKQFHDSLGTSRPTGGNPTFSSCTGAGRHGPCNDTILSIGDDATCPQLLPVPVDEAVGFAVDPDHGLVGEHVVLAESIDPPWHRFDLDMLRTVRLLV